MYRHVYGHACGRVDAHVGEHVHGRVHASMCICARCTDIRMDVCLHMSMNVKVRTCAGMRVVYGHLRGHVYRHV